MHTHSAYDYAVIRVVPRVERGEFVNAGIVLSCRSCDFLEARIDLDEARLRALAPDIDLAVVHRHLAAFPTICAGGAAAGPIGMLSKRERFHWLTAARSTMIQTSPAHSGRCLGSAAMIERLLDTMVRTTPGPRRDDPLSDPC